MPAFRCRCVRNRPTHRSHGCRCAACSCATRPRHSGRPPVRPRNWSWKPLRAAPPRRSFPNCRPQRARRAGVRRAAAVRRRLRGRLAAAAIDQTLFDRAQPRRSLGGAWVAGGMVGRGRRRSQDCVTAGSDAECCGRQRRVCDTCAVTGCEPGARSIGADDGSHVRPATTIARATAMGLDRGRGRVCVLVDRHAGVGVATSAWYFEQ